MIFKVENQFFKVKVKGLKEELAEFKAKLENVSNAKPIVDPDTNSILAKLIFVHLKGIIIFLFYEKGIIIKEEKNAYFATIDKIKTYVNES